MKHKIYWKISEETHDFLSSRIFKSSKIKKPHSINMLMFMLFDLTEYCMEIRDINPDVWICLPQKDYLKNKQIVYSYKDFAKLCRWKTVKTLKKYLDLLVEVKVLAPYQHPADDSLFFATVIWENL